MVLARAFFFVTGLLVIGVGFLVHRGFPMRPGDVVYGLGVLAVMVLGVLILVLSVSSEPSPSEVDEGEVVVS